MDAVAAAKAVVPLILANRDAAEELRHMPPPVATAFAEAGLFQMYLPRSMGGPELPPLSVFRAIEAISAADGSAGWCAMIATSQSAFLGWLPEAVGREMCRRPADFRASGSLRPLGRAYAVEGGYRVEGRWDFASGVDHANWVNGTCILMDGDQPRLTQAGTPAVRTFWLPVAQATIEDTWSVIGMRGTGSHDFVVDGVFVPAAHSFSLAERPCEQGALYTPRLVFTVLWTGTVATALGIARGAVDAFIVLAGQAGSSMSSTLLRDRPFVQARVAEAEAILNAARAYVIDAVSGAWAAVCDGVADPGPAIAQARLAIVHGMHEAMRSVDVVFHAAGTNAVYSRNPLERYFRDVHVAVQHAAGMPVHYESAGRVLLGLRPPEGGW